MFRIQVNCCHSWNQRTTDWISSFRIAQLHKAILFVTNTMSTEHSLLFTQGFIQYLVPFSAISGTNISSQHKSPYQSFVQFVNAKSKSILSSLDLMLWELSIEDFLQFFGLFTVYQFINIKCCLLQFFTFRYTV